MPTLDEVITQLRTYRDLHGNLRVTDAYDNGGGFSPELQPEDPENPADPRQCLVLCERF